MTKQVKNIVAAEAVAATTNNKPNNLYMSVKTFDQEGKTIGERIVDLFHFGTRGWLQQHIWWAMLNSNCVEVNIATPEETAAYLASGVTALAEKFNGPSKEAVAA